MDIEGLIVFGVIGLAIVVLLAMGSYAVGEMWGKEAMHREAISRGFGGYDDDLEFYWREPE